ncbi:MAG: NAD(P)/FAD-dependent oxidoreductase [Lachnospiraceae bacterium]|nr:NAD(P)/FAD-dependent oxidoreductase [Lachnospiraceae bacterium]
MIRLTGVSLPLLKRTQEEEHRLLQKKAEALLRLRGKMQFSLQILSRSIDARKKPQLKFVYTLLIDGLPESLEERLIGKSGSVNIQKYDQPVYSPATGTPDPVQSRPVIVGAGPAGLFCALALATAGRRPLIIERGKRVEERVTDVERFWETGQLNSSSNVQFGEGGAGTFSDGKLNTGIKDRTGRIRFVLETLCAHGAPQSILIDQKPHIGTDRLRDVLIALRKTILSLGGEFLFETCLRDIRITDHAVSGIRVNDGVLIDTDTVVLAIGHSARDTFRSLLQAGVPMTAKDFAVGLRVTHPQEFIDRAQYGLTVDEMKALGLKSAPYKLTHQTKDGRGVYSFCMCPGGYIVNASSEEQRLCVNGMSLYARDSGRANSGIVVSFRKEDLSSDHPLAGLFFQEELETRTFTLAGGRVPVESVSDFEKGVLQRGQVNLSAFDDGLSKKLCIKGASSFSSLHTLLPKELSLSLLEGMKAFDQTIPGFFSEDAWFAGVESRTSSPVRILRNDSLQTEIAGLYPCGEGAGYAGGIVSAAVDGLKVAEKIISGSP